MILMKALDLGRIWTVAERSRIRRLLSPADVAFVRDAVPGNLDLRRRALPKTMRHPDGFSVSERRSERSSRARC
jgi:hypothetical protein